MASGNTNRPLSCVITWVKLLFLEKDCFMKQLFFLNWKSLKAALAVCFRNDPAQQDPEIWTGASRHDNNINNLWQYILDIDTWDPGHSSPKSMERSSLSWAIYGNQRWVSALVWALFQHLLFSTHHIFHVFSPLKIKSVHSSVFSVQNLHLQDFCFIKKKFNINLAVK